MKRDEIEIESAEYVLGTLDVEARARLRGRFAGEPDLRHAVRAWEERLSVLNADEAPLDPPAGLWDRIAPALDSAQDDAPGSGFSVTIRASEGQWEVVGEGVLKKRLFVDREEGFEAFLLRLEAGACVPAHPHSMREECIMLEGEISIGDLHLSAGDYHVVPAGTDHPDVHSKTGGLLYVRGELRAAAG